VITFIFQHNSAQYRNEFIEDLHKQIRNAKKSPVKCPEQVKEVEIAASLAPVGDEEVIPEAKEPVVEDEKEKKEEVKMTKIKKDRKCRNAMLMAIRRTQEQNNQSKTTDENLEGSMNRKRVVDNSDLNSIDQNLDHSMNKKIVVSVINNQPGEQIDVTQKFQFLLKAENNEQENMDEDLGSSKTSTSVYTTASSYTSL